MQLQLFKKQYFKHESQSLNFQVIVHSQLPIYFQIKLLFFVFLYIKPAYLNKSMCISQVWSDYFRSFWGHQREHFNDKIYNIDWKNVTKFDILTDEGSVPEMRIWSILLIKSDLKWCIHLSRSLFLYFNYLVGVTAGGPVSPRGHM